MEVRVHLTPFVCEIRRYRQEKYSVPCVLLSFFYDLFIIEPFKAITFGEERVVIRLLEIVTLYSAFHASGAEAETLYVPFATAREVSCSMVT